MNEANRRLKTLKPKGKKWGEIKRITVSMSSKTGTRNGKMK